MGKTLAAGRAGFPNILPGKELGLAMTRPSRMMGSGRDEDREHRFQIERS